eukprot:scaffold82441_cov27-Tisochrysis_lutea.AAC.1
MGVFRDVKIVFDCPTTYVLKTRSAAGGLGRYDEGEESSQAIISWAARQTSSHFDAVSPATCSVGGDLLSDRRAFSDHLALLVVADAIGTH